MYNLNDTLLIAVVCNASSGGKTGPDADPTFAIFEEGNASPVMTGTLLVVSGYTDLYWYLATLSNANGFHDGKQYTVYVGGAVGSVNVSDIGTFKIDWPPIDVNATGASEFKTAMEGGYLTGINSRTVLPIQADLRKVMGEAITGTGTTNDPFVAAP
jgi:hypothetical protein